MDYGFLNSWQKERMYEMEMLLKPLLNFWVPKNAYVIQENRFNFTSLYLNFLFSWHCYDAVLTLCSLTDRLSGTVRNGHFRVCIMFNSWTPLLLSNKTLVYFSPFSLSVVYTRRRKSALVHFYSLHSTLHPKLGRPEVSLCMHKWKYK